VRSIVIINPAARRRSQLSNFFALIMIVGSLAIFGPSAPLLARQSPSTQSAELKSLLARLQRHYQQTNSFSASFKQTVARVGAPPQSRSGKVLYLKPGRVRFDFGDPQPETIVSDGKLLYDYDPGLNQVMETPLKNAIKTQAVAAFLLGVGNVERDFTASQLATPANDGLIHLLLKPRHGGDDIELALQAHTLDIASLKLADALGNVTNISFTDLKPNVAIAPSHFEFEPPAGADVVTSGSH
jgi:outer membrane lipoprotein carrier protein